MLTDRVNAGVRVGDVLRARQETKTLVAVSAAATVAEVLDTLAANNMVSAPVKDEENDVYLGVANALELFAYAGLLEGNKEDKLGDAVVRVLESNPDNLFLWKCDASDPLDKVLSAFRQGVHRVLAFDAAHPSEAPVLLSQSDVIKFLNAHPELVPSDETVRNGLGFVASENTGAMVTCTEDMTAAQAFAVLAEKEMSAVPIVDANGRIVGTLSATDLRGITPAGDCAAFALLSTEKVMDFLVAIKARGAAAPVSVGKDAKIGEILIPLSYAGVHRVWVVDADKKPVGVVSMTDVIARVRSAGAH